LKAFLSAADGLIARKASLTAVNKIQAYATLRRVLITVRPWRYWQVAFQTSLDAPETIVA
jgi:hypothetical protein